MDPVDGAEIRRIPPEVADRLGYYVYLYSDPRNGKAFYVGKGQGSRVLVHLSAEAESRKVAMLGELARAGLEPELDILAHALKDEETAFRVEAAVIDALGLDQLTNEVRGWRSIQLGRMPLRELVIYYGAKPVEVQVSALLIRINRLFRHTMSSLELYEATRGIWKLSARRTNAEFAFAVFEGVVRDVFTIDSWHRAGTTQYTTRPTDGWENSTRWEFIGRPADAETREQYVDRSVAAYFRQGQRTPVVYVNC
ncbi:MAG: uncharacterized protein QOC81_3700 [Thermoanaerobaculia bacterium]|jgi:hypothetical protein|nr:uncharacterized protein [Thermoanaerobaculia bacterium]